jgi:hypothetical protein
MTTSSTSSASPPMSRSDYVSTLPPWRRLLAMFNWRPVYDIEQRTSLLRKQTEQLKKENARLAAIESRLARFEREHLSGSNPLSSTGDSSPS